MLCCPKCGRPGCDCEDPDLTKCPRCGAPADNGHDRCLPPNPYLCTKCSADVANGSVPYES